MGNTNPLNRLEEFARRTRRTQPQEPSKGKSGNLGEELLVGQTQPTQPQEPSKGKSGNPIDNIVPIVERVIQQSKAFRLNSNLFRSYDPLGKFLPENVYVEKFNEAVPLANYRSSPIHATFLVTPKNGGSPVVMSFGNTPWYGNITITRYNSENNSFETRVAVVPHDVTWPSGDLSENIRKMIEALNKQGYNVEQIPQAEFDRMLTHPSNYPKNYYYHNPLINTNPQEKSQLPKEEEIPEEGIQLG